MNIIKVIVSDLPPYCSECYFETYEGECGATLEFANTPRQIDTKDGGFESRPNWCPLVKEESKNKATISKSELNVRITDLLRAQSKIIRHEYKTDHVTERLKELVDERDRLKEKLINLYIGEGEEE